MGVGTHTFFFKVSQGPIYMGKIQGYINYGETSGITIVKMGYIRNRRFRAEAQEIVIFDNFLDAGFSGEFSKNTSCMLKIQKQISVMKFKKQK